MSFGDIHSRRQYHTSIISVHPAKSISPEASRFRRGLLGSRSVGAPGTQDRPQGAGVPAEPGPPADSPSRAGVRAGTLADPAASDRTFRANDRSWRHSSTGSSGARSVRCACWDVLTRMGAESGMSPTHLGALLIGYEKGVEHLASELRFGPYRPPASDFRRSRRSRSYRHHDRSLNPGWICHPLHLPSYLRLGSTWMWPRPDSVGTAGVVERTGEAKREALARRGPVAQERRQNPTLSPLRRHAPSDRFGSSNRRSSPETATDARSSRVIASDRASRRSRATA